MPLLFRFRPVAGHVALDEVQQDVGHVLALAGGYGLEPVVQLDRDVQIHPLHFTLWLGWHRFHLLSG